VGMYDVLTLANEKLSWSSLLTGSYSVSLGDTLSAFIGSGRQTHIVGDEIKYVLDWEGCLERIPYLHGLLNSFPISLLLGEGGNMTWTYGRKTDLHYFGPAIAIKRAGTLSATSKSNFFASDDLPPAKDKDKGHTIKEGAEWAAKQKIAGWTGVPVALLSAAMLAISTGYEITARINYQDKYKKADKEATEKMTSMCTVSLLLTTRMMYVVKAIELCTANAQNSISDFFDAENEIKLGTLALACSGLTPALRKDISEKSKNAFKKLKTFLSDNAELIKVIVFILIMLAVLAAAIASSNTKK
jgi:hypothetical protein